MIKKLFTLLFLCILCIGSAWGETYSMTPDNATTGSTSTNYVTNATTFTYNGIEWSFIQWNPKTLQIKTNQTSAGSEFNFKNTSAFPGKITSVVITFSALTVSDASKLCFVGGSSVISSLSGGTAGTWNSTNKTLTWTPSATDNFTYFAFYQNGKAASGTNNLATSNAIVVTYEKTTSPYIIADNVNLAADATSGEINYTLENASGSTMTAAEKTDVDWISNVTVDAENSKVYFSTTANTAHTTREAIITLTYGTVTRDVKVIQAKYSIYASLVELVEAGTPTSSGDSVTVTLTNEPIIKFYESTSNPEKNNGIYLMAGEKEVEIYCQNVPESWIIGGTVSGTLTDCTWKIYDGTWELCPDSWDELTYTDPTQKTVTFVSLGKTLGTLQTLDYVNLEEAPEATPLTGWTFAGWTADKTFLMSETAPTFFTNTTLVTEDINLYAVFKKTEGGESESEELTNTEVISLSSSKALAYATEKTYSGENIDYSIYAFTDNTSRHWIQLKKDKGVYIKISAPGNITNVAVTITGASNSSGGINDISKHDAFTGEIAILATDRTYSAASSPVLAATSIITNNVATLVPTDDASEVYLKVSSGARIWGITTTYIASTTTYSTLAYSRTVTADEYGTICLPYASSETSGATFYSIAGKKNEGSSIVLNEVGGNLEAGTPYIFKANGNTITVTFTGEPVAEAKEVNGLIGTFVTIDNLQDEWTELDDIYVISGTKFYFVNSVVKCEAYRAFIAMSDVPNATTEAKGDVELFNASAPTDINGVNFVVANASARYNIAGQKVNSSYKGIVIMNGKKYLNK